MEARHPRGTCMPPKVKEGAGQGAWVGYGLDLAVRDRSVSSGIGWIADLGGIRVIDRL